MMDAFEEEERKKGRKPDQRTKAFLNRKLIMEEADENHCLTSDEIAEAIADHLPLRQKQAVR